MRRIKYFWILQCILIKQDPALIGFLAHGSVEMYLIYGTLWFFRFCGFSVLQLGAAEKPILRKSLRGSPGTASASKAAGQGLLQVRPPAGDPRQLYKEGIHSLPTVPRIHRNMNAPKQGSARLCSFPPEHRDP